jgi:hypothetical protein
VGKDTPACRIVSVVGQIQKCHIHWRISGAVAQTQPVSPHPSSFNPRKTEVDSQLGNSTECGNVCKTGMSTHSKRHPAFTNLAAVFPSAWDPIIACPGAEFCCELDSNDPSGCCNLTNTTAHPLYQLGSASTVTVIGSSPTTVPSVTIISIVPGGSQTSSVPISPNSNNNGNSSGSGAKIGIGVGVGGGVILILAALAFFFFRKTGRVSDTHPPLNTAQDIGMGKAELAAGAALAPAYYEQSNVPIEDGYKKEGDVTMSSHIPSSQRMSELP